MEHAIGIQGLAQYYEEKATKLSQAIEHRYWDERRQLYANEPDHRLFSEHVQALAVLSGVAGDRSEAILKRAAAVSFTAKCSLYFHFYLHKAMDKARLGNEYLNRLTLWRRMLPDHVTTWPEDEKVEGRSDCHGWSSHPNIYLSQIVLGVRPSSPGFRTLEIRPHLGNLTFVAGRVSLAQGGTVSMRYTLHPTELYYRAQISVPVPAKLFWFDRTMDLPLGDSIVYLPLTHLKSPLITRKIQ